MSKIPKPPPPLRRLPPANEDTAWVTIGAVWVASTDNPRYQYKVRLEVGQLLLLAHAAAAKGEAYVWAQLYATNPDELDQNPSRPCHRVRVAMKKAGSFSR